MMRDAAAETGVGGEKRLHSLTIACENDNQIIPLVFHHLKQYLDRLLPVIALVFRTVEIIGFVDKQHAAHRFFKDFLGLRRGVADILADQIVTGDRDQMAFAHQTQPVENARHPHRDSGFSSAGIPGKAHMQSWGFGHEAKPLARRID